MNKFENTGEEEALKNENFSVISIEISLENKEKYVKQGMEVKMELQGAIM